MAHYACMLSLQKAIREYGGTILWENEFESWTTEKQEEMIIHLWGAIIYVQTTIGAIQPCWVHLEHEYSQYIQNVIRTSKSYYIKTYGGIAQTVFQCYPRSLFKILSLLKNNLNINQEFQIVPDYRFFHFLNHMEIRDYENQVNHIIEITLQKMRQADMSEIVAGFKYVPSPQLYKI